MSKKLIGSDGALYVGTFGAEIIAAATLAEGKLYEVTGIDASASGFPAGAAVGYLVQGDGAITLAGTDKALPFTGTQMCDIQSWSMDFSKAEVDVTTLCSNNKEYRASKYDDITGNLEGIMTSEITDAEDYIMNHFVTVVDDTGATYKLYPKDNQEIIAQLYTDDESGAGETFSFYYLPIVLTGFSASAGGDDAQTFSSPFRAASSTAGVAYYKFNNPTP